MENLYDDYDNFTGKQDDDSNSTQCEAGQMQEWIATYIQVAVFVVVFCLGVVGNVLVITTFARYRCLRLRCMTDVFLVYLALSDLLLLLTLPLQTSEILIKHWPLGNDMCRLNHGLYTISTFGGLLLLAFISIDRFLLVVCSKVAQAIRPCMRLYSMLSVVIVTVSSIVLSIPELRYAAVHPNGDGEDGTCMHIVTSSSEVKMWARATKITGFCIPFTAMLVCYSAIAYVLLQGRGNCWRRQRTLRLIVALVVLFLLFQLPYTVVLIVRLSIESISDCSLWISLHLAEDITRSLAYIRCCLNPLLYALVGVRFRNDVKKLLHEAGCLFKWSPRSENGSSATPSSPPPTSFVPDAYVFPRMIQDIKGSYPVQKFVF